MMGTQGNPYQRPISTLPEARLEGKFKEWVMETAIERMGGMDAARARFEVERGEEARQEVAKEEANAAGMYQQAYHQMANRQARAQRSLMQNAYGFYSSSGTAGLIGSGTSTSAAGSQAARQGIYDQLEAYMSRLMK